jgi:prepilin-type N-terminal cleavage/methylation domain-containing protein/prepilin-type processing-associated H-X9-DG protein
MSSPPSRVATGGFTLIELLVVVVIIAILAGLLLPAIGLARRSAQNLECLSSLRQIGFGLEAYSQDHSGFVVPLVAPEETPFSGTWHNQIMPYVESTLGDPDSGRGGVFYGCPRWLGRSMPSGKLARTGYGYGMNVHPDLPGNLRRSNFRKHNPSTASGQWGPVQVFHQDQISHASERLYVADGNDWHQLSLRNEETIYESIGPDWSGSGRRHGDRINILFFDLHVAATAYPDAYRSILDPGEP